MAAADGLTWPASRTQWDKAHPPGTTNVQSGMSGEKHEQPDTSRIKSTHQSHNVNLQHRVAFLQAQLSCHLGHLTRLKTKVKALESELTSLKANLSLGANPVPVSSKAADSVAASPIAEGTTPPRSPASAPAQDLHRLLPGQHHEPTPPAPGFVGNHALCDPRPKGADCSGTALTSSGQGECGAVPLETTVQAARSPSATQEPKPASDSPPGAPDDEQVGADPTCTQTASAEIITAVAEQAENSSSCSSAPPTAAKASATSRHPLHDLWADSRDNSPPASNTRYRGLRDDSVRQRAKSSLPNGRVAYDGANADGETSLGPVHDNVGHRKRGAEEPESTPVAKMTSKAELVAPTEPTCRDIQTPVFWHATEGREGAEDRSSHLMDCALCQGSPPENEAIGRCGACPRSFCSHCIEHGLHERGVDLEGLDQDGRSMLQGEKGDFFVEQCPHCIRGCDESFAAPSPGAVPMEHLLNELLRHDLSICFREPVDTDKHPDYVESIGRDAMMDLGTMLDKLKRKRYPRRRGPGQFLDDLNRIWRNCRRYAGCDELGQPHYGKTVPGIVRCALILEAMSMKFCAAYMPENQGTEAWQESTWDFHRERQERMNAEARLEQLKNQGKPSDNKKAKPLESSGVAAKQGYRENSSNGGVVGTSPGEEDGKPGDGGGTESCPVQQTETYFSGGGGRKRRAAEMKEEPHAERADAGAHSVARTMLEANGETSRGTPKILKPSARTTQPPWSPLDKLCDLASTFHK